MGRKKFHGPHKFHGPQKFHGPHKFHGPQNQGHAPSPSSDGLEYLKIETLNILDQTKQGSVI